MVLTTSSLKPLSLNTTRITSGASSFFKLPMPSTTSRVIASSKQMTKAPNPME
ncbi:hypothetical protein BMETH_635_0 [methanotrophic bacterial endosymbiont of Bathymodiolus sp.]|nr:hypothetical protein BMETH_635_0 [methanotrophic bacterial endosymbiont of Bathymodiolus sp.]